MEGAVSLDRVVASLASIGSMPLTIHGLFVVGLVVGLILWLFGKKLLKPAFALFGLFMGGLIGLLLSASLLPATVAGVPTVYLGIGVGAVLGLIQGLATFRFAMAISAALIVALAASLGAAAWMKFEPLKRASETMRQAPAALISSAEKPPADTTSQPLAERLKPVAERVEAFASDIWSEFRQEWASLQPSQQTTMVLAGLGGLLGGLIVGLIFPKRMSIVVTALLGSAVWVPCGVWLAAAMDMPGKQFLTQSASTWLMVWFSLAALGVIIQTTMLNRSAKPAKE